MMFSYCFRLKNSPEFPAEGDRHILFVDQGSCFTDMYVVRVNGSQCEVVHSESSNLEQRILIACSSTTLWKR